MRVCVATMKDARADSEIELKLLVPLDAVRRLAAHRLLRGRTRPARRRLYSIYFDTPALDLWRQGIALRVRREGRRWMQTVKGGGSAHGGLHQRAEAEAEVAGPAPDTSRIRDRELAEAFASPQLRAQLTPVFTTDITRSSRVLELGAEARVEASVDLGVIRSGDRSEAVSEIELELKSGEPHQLYELALKLADDVPLSIGDRSKAERGFALARGEPVKPVKARPVVLDRDMTVIDAFKAVMWVNLAHLQANEAGMLGARDPEYLHQMRVALRRLRSALAVFAPLFPEPVISPARTELKWLANGLGPARDWDVLVTEMLPQIAAEFGAHAGLMEFSARCEKLRRRANGPLPPPRAVARGVAHPGRRARAHRAARADGVADPGGGFRCHGAGEPLRPGAKEGPQAWRPVGDRAAPAAHRDQEIPLRRRFPCGTLRGQGGARGVETAVAAAGYSGCDERRRDCCEADHARFLARAGPARPGSEGHPSRLEPGPGGDPQARAEERVEGIPLR